MDPSQKLRFLLLDTVLGTDVLVIERVSGQDALGSPFEYQVIASSKADDFDVDDLIGTKVSIRIETALLDGDPYRYISGIVSQVDHVGYDLEGLSQYQLTVVPWLWLLTRTSDCRIFQNLTVPEILEQVFADMPMADFQPHLEREYPQREYCVQYRETDFNFVQRLMEHEGIYYFWEHGENHHRMILCDSMAVHEPVIGLEEIRHRADVSGIQEEFIISSWRSQNRVTPGKYAINSFDFKSPKPSANTKLLGRSDQKHKYAEGNHEIYDNPGGYVERPDGERLAGIRREEIQCHTRTATARTNARGLYAGCKFKVRELPKSALDGEYLLISASLSAAAGNYGSSMGGGEATCDCQFTAIPTASVFRPRRTAVAGRVEGPQTAIVSGPAGQEVHVDRYGRVKVQFLWDREGTFDAGSSCWVRVSQSWAGANFGGMAIPRIGQEVIVDFLEGDPDRPIITGRVYNGANMPYSSNAGRDEVGGGPPPADLTEAHMMTSFKSNSLGGGGGHNEITMNDRGGSETLFFKAQKDEIHKVGHDRIDKVARDERRRVGRNREKTVVVNQSETIGVNKTISVGSNHTETIGANMTLTVGAVKTETVGAASIETVGAAKTLTVGAAYILSVGAAVNMTVGGASTEEVGAEKQLNVGKHFTVDAGDEITLRTGGSEIKMKKDGTITITGKVIKISASDNLEMDGGKFSLKSPAGTGSVTAATILEVKGANVKINS